MRFGLKGSVMLQPLETHLLLEGNEIVPVDKAEFVITDNPEVNSGSLPSMRSGGVLSSIITRELGFELSDFASDFVLSRWFDSRLGWGDQVWLGIPIEGLAMGGTSARVQSGICGCFLRSRNARALFERIELSEFFQESRHSGFVTLRLSSDDMKVSGIETGIPGSGLYNVLEGIPSTLSEFFIDPVGTRFMESWSISLVVSRWPWPLVLETKGKTQIGGLDEEKHLWLTSHTKFRNSVYTTNTFVGVATAWARTLTEANARVVKTCRTLQIEEIQYRTDGAYVSGEIMGRIKQNGLFGD